MYLEHWQLKEKPFENTPDPKYLYYSKQHEEALFRMLYAIHEKKGAALLTGEYGCGKTLLMRKIIKEVGPDFNIAYLTNPRWTALELISEILYQLEVQTDSEQKVAMLRALNEHLFKTMRAGHHTILIVDEAQSIEDSNTLEELRLLLNFQLNDRFLLTFFLVGQPELIPIVKNIPQLNQRISVRFHLTQLGFKDTVEYINYRLEIAGSKEQIFEHDAYKEIYELSNGTPRLINNICDVALVVGYGKKLKSIPADLITYIRKSEAGGM